MKVVEKVMKILSRIINIKLGKTMRKKLASLFIMVVMTIGLVGCGNKKDVGKDDSSPEVTETPEEETTEEYTPVEMELLDIQWLLNILKVC